MPTPHTLICLGLLTLALGGLAPFTWCLFRSTMPRITVLVIRPSRSLQRVSGYAGTDAEEV